MTISIGPYKSSIPFINIQDVRFNTDSNGDYVVTLGISNEQKTLLRKKNKKFNNFIYFSNSKTEIELLASDRDLLKQTIKNNSQNNYAFAPSYKDYTVKARTEKSKDIYSFFYQKNFVIPQASDLYVLVCSTLEVGQTILVGNVVKETIVSGNQTLLNSTVYRLAETSPIYGTQGTIWPGSAHIQNNNFMVGNTHIEGSHPNLEITQVPNIRVKDLRIIRTIDSLNFRYTKMNNSYFSPITLSRGSNGKVNGSFTFNILNFAKNNTRFGGLIENNQTLLTAVNIKDIIIYQKSSGYEAAGNSLTPGRSQKCGLKEDSRYKRVASLRNGCSIVDNILNNGNLGQVFFVDQTTEGINSGVAEYKAEIILEDNTKELIESLLAPLRTSMRKISSIREIPDLQSSYMEIINDFLSSVQVILGAKPFSTYSRRQWKKNLLAFINRFNPSYGSDKQMFLSTMNDYISNLESILHPKKKKDETFSVDSKIYMSTHDPTLRVEYIFGEVYYFTGTKDFGLNYLDDNVTEVAPALPSISFADYTTRANSEVSKYNITNTQADVLNPFGYLTANSINLLPNPLSINTGDISVQTVSALPLIESRTNKDRVFKANKSQKASSAVDNILAGLNISARRNKRPLREIVGSKKMFKSIVDAEDYLSATSDFIFEKGAGTAQSGSTTSNVTATPSVNIYSNSLIGNIVEQSVTSFVPVTTITNQEALAGSPALQKFNEDSTVLQSGSALSNAINYNSVAQVQYLDSYDVTVGVANQNWKLLNKEKFSKASTEDKPLMCRLVKVSDAVGTSDILNMEPMTSMFIVGTPSVSNNKRSISGNTNKVKRSVANEIPSIDLDDVGILYSKNITLSRSTSRNTRSTSQSNQTRELSIETNTDY
mgnify:CR=1 FL=1